MLVYLPSLRAVSTSVSLGRLSKFADGRIIGGTQTKSYVSGGCGSANDRWYNSAEENMARQDWLRLGHRSILRSVITQPMQGPMALVPFSAWSQMAAAAYLGM